MNDTTTQPLKETSAVLELADIQKTLGLPDADFVRTVKLDYSGSSWGKIKSGTFSGNAEKAAKAASRALAIHRTGGETELLAGRLVFPHVREILDAVDIARAADDEHKLIVVCGQQGSGKTAIAKLLRDHYAGRLLDSFPSCQSSYMRSLLIFAAGIGLVPSFRSTGEAESTIFEHLKCSPGVICLDEFNYASREFIGFLKAVLNQTPAVLAVFTIPGHLARMAAMHSEESKQFLRRAQAIVHIPQVSSAEVMAVHTAFFPEIVLGSHAPAIAAKAGALNHIDSVFEIFREADPADPSDLPEAIRRVEGHRITVAKSAPKS